MEEKLAAIAVDDPLVQLLMSLTGIDYFAALLILAEIGSWTGSLVNAVL